MNTFRGTYQTCKVNELMRVDSRDFAWLEKVLQVLEVMDFCLSVKI